MFEIIESVNDVGRRVFSLFNTESGKNLGNYRFYGDALVHMKRLEAARMRRLRDRNVRIPA